MESSPVKTDLIQEALREAQLLCTPEKFFSNWVASLNTPPKRDQEVPKRMVYLPKKWPNTFSRLPQNSTPQKSTPPKPTPHRPSYDTPDSPLKTSLTEELLYLSPDEQLLPPEETPRVRRVDISPICPPVETDDVPFIHEAANGKPYSSASMWHNINEQVRVSYDSLWLDLVVFVTTSDSISVCTSALAGFIT